MKILFLALISGFSFLSGSVVTATSVCDGNVKKTTYNVTKVTCNFSGAPTTRWYNFTDQQFGDFSQGKMNKLRDYLIKNPDVSDAFDQIFTTQKLDTSTAAVSGSPGTFGALCGAKLEGTAAKDNPSPVITREVFLSCVNNLTGAVHWLMGPAGTEPQTEVSAPYLTQAFQLQVPASAPAAVDSTR